MAAKAKRKYRCGRGGCRAIYHLNHPPEWYPKTKKCTAIGCRGTLHDYTNERKRNKAQNCYCDGYPWDGPHKKGSAPWCKYSKREPTEEEYEERYYGR